jgi:hypothetical protein
VGKRNKISDNAKKHAIEKYEMTAAAFEEMLRMMRNIAA